MIEDICKFIRDIEADPEKIITGLTVRDYLTLRLHLSFCLDCQESANRVNERYKNEEPNLGDYFNEN